MDFSYLREELQGGPAWLGFVGGFLDCTSWAVTALPAHSWPDGTAQCAHPETKEAHPSVRQGEARIYSLRRRQFKNSF